MESQSAISSNKTTKISIYEQEKKGFDKFISELRDSAFQVLYLILKDDDSSLLAFAINILLDYLQMLAFVFEDKV